MVQDGPGQEATVWLPPFEVSLILKTVWCSPVLLSFLTLLESKDILTGAVLGLKGQHIFSLTSRGIEPCR